MSENIVIMMISISTFLGAIGVGALIWAVRTGQFDDHSKFIDAVRHDNIEDLQDAISMSEKKKAYKEKKKQERLNQEKSYRPAD
ncbi:Type cbb3 cytochrome oxidase biogenesis protein CcoS, involved in heme b insertion [hydrothermal vent metagenome]|uniref:Type cbb3 cytochrome oxidase biogenesis protein CcoS, involved in heme b insertion n=1 Tax=hydrothermal vent metagenome TaxID=652676 RepID=A0A1W1CV02_9ZZZZ